MPRVNTAHKNSIALQARHCSILVANPKLYDPRHSERTLIDHTIAEHWEICGGHMGIISFVTHHADIRHILDHIGLESEPSIWSLHAGLRCGGVDAQVSEGGEVEPDWDLAAQPAPDYEVDQRVNW